VLDPMDPVGGLAVSWELPSFGPCLPLMFTSKSCGPVGKLRKD